MFIGTCNGNQVMYYRNRVWVRNTSLTFFHAGTKQEAIKKARRKLSNFEEVA